MTASSRIRLQFTSRHAHPGEMEPDALLTQVDKLVAPYLKSSISESGRLADGRTAYQRPSEVPAIRALVTDSLSANADEVIELLVPFCVRFDKAALRAGLVDLEKPGNGEEIEAKITQLTLNINRFRSGKANADRLLRPSLLSMLLRRRSLLAYLKRKDAERYKKLSSNLKIK